MPNSNSKAKAASRRPRTGDRRRTRQPLKIDKLPSYVWDAIRFLYNEANLTWEEIEERSAEEFNPFWREEFAKRKAKDDEDDEPAPPPSLQRGFVDWHALSLKELEQFPDMRLPHTTLQRWHDIRVDQIQADAIHRAIRARELGAVFAKAAMPGSEHAVMNAARDIIMGLLSENSSEDTRVLAAKGFLKLAEVQQKVRTNVIRERKVKVDERKIVQLEKDAEVRRKRMDEEADKLTAKASKGEVTPEDVQRLRERVFGLPPKACGGCLMSGSRRKANKLVAAVAGVAVAVGAMIAPVTPVEPKTALSAVLPLRRYQQRWIDDGSRMKIAVKSARIGFSFATALEAVLDCIESPKATWTVLSASKPQSVEFIQTCHLLLELIQGAVQLYQDETFYDELGSYEAIQQRVTLPNGSRIIALAANPRTARGYPGNAILDEFGHHAESLCKSGRQLHAQTSLGHKIRVLSTPNGEQGKFFDLCKELGLTDGVAPESNFTKVKGWSVHWIDAAMAISEGCPINLEEMRQMMQDEDIVNQEFNCIFLKSSGAWLPLALIQACEDDAATLDLPANFRPRGPLFGGIDVGRIGDQTTFWLKESIGDVLWTRMVIALHGMTFPDQCKTLTPYVKMTSRTGLDSTGMGIALWDLLNVTCPGRVMAVKLRGIEAASETTKKKKNRVLSGAEAGSVSMKVDLAIKLKRSMEGAKERIPYDMDIRTELQAIKREPTSTGVTFDAPRISIETGVAGGPKRKGFQHADRFWACSLATYASGSYAISTDFTASDQLTAYSQSGAYL